MTLRHELGADDDVEAPGGDVGQFLAHAFDGGDEVAGKNQEACIREQLAHLFFESFHARPDGNDVSMDRESLNLAEAQLKYKTGIALLHIEYQKVMDAIHADK